MVSLVDFSYMYLHVIADIHIEGAFMVGFNCIFTNDHHDNFVVMLGHELITNFHLEKSATRGL